MKKTNLQSDSQISVVIITKDRVKELSECLTSLATQSTAPNEVIVIDSSSTTSAKSTIRTFQKHIKFPFYYFSKIGKDYGVLRNEGLRRATFSWIAFIDDDCVADGNWIAMMKQVISKENVQVLVGQSDPYFTTSLPSLTTNFMDLFWKLRRIDNDGNILSFEITDTKNLLISKKFLIKNNILFREGLLFGGKGEDCRLGFDLQQANAKGKYSSEMKVLHKDTQSWKEYYKKLWTETWAYQENVSAIQQEVVKKNNVQLTKIPFGHFFNKYCDEFEVRGVRKLLLLLHISFSWLIIKNFRWFA